MADHVANLVELRPEGVPRPEVVVRDDVRPYPTTDREGEVAAGVFTSGAVVPGRAAGLPRPLIPRAP